MSSYLFQQMRNHIHGYTPADEKPSCIRHNLFLGGAKPIINQTWELDVLGVHHILCFDKEVPAHPLIPRTVFDWDDTPSQPLFPDIETACQLLEDLLKKGPVYVHCYAGVSRSASVVAYHLMRTEGLTLAQALASIREKRPCINPNSGFIAQLERQTTGSGAASAHVAAPSTES
jgi:dual specificity phosphatase 12